MALKFAKRNGLLAGEIVDFYIPNPSCGIDVCKGATDLCKRYCYGNGVYRHSQEGKRRLSTEETARENYRISQTDSFVDEMETLINEKNPVSRIRIHSIGDFYSDAYFEKWIQVMNRYPEIQFTAYVKNFEVLKNYKNRGGIVPENFNVLLSFYPDTYDRYSVQGGRQYVNELFDELQKYYRAKIYVVCSREYFYSEIKKEKVDKIFCNGGTEMLCKEYGFEPDEYETLFVPGQGCAECLKCYDNDRCPEGSVIYAVLRASGQLANLGAFLRKNRGKYPVLEEMCRDMH